MKTIYEYTKKLNLLYVEDDHFMRESTTELLLEFFDSVDVAVNGEDGYENFIKNQQKIDIIITDITMPKLDGIGMIKKIREIDNSIPIVILSAYNESNYFMDSISLGVDGYLMKPIDLDTFTIVLKKIVTRLKTQEELQNQILLSKQYQDAIDETAIVSKGDKKGIITYVNDNFCQISGHTREELIGKNHNIVRHPDSKKDTFKQIWETIKGTSKNRPKIH